MQFAPLAPTYAAINAIAILRSVDAYRIIDRWPLQLLPVASVLVSPKDVDNHPGRLIGC